ncbi:type V toxin-antitoxin system endoribonuclease antitoxin GhoS [Salmonella enterica]
MSSDGIARYVVTVKFHEQSLTEINELNNHFTRAGFLLTMTDAEGKVHDLGTNTFGFVSALSEDEVRELANSLAESAIEGKADISVDSWETWQKEEH